MGKAIPTAFDSNVASDIPTLEPQKRVGGGEFVKVQTDTKELANSSGLVEKALDTLGLKPLKVHQQAAAAKRAAKELADSLRKNGGGYNGQPGLNPAPISPYNKMGNSNQVVSPVEAALGAAGINVPVNSDDFFSFENNPLMAMFSSKNIKDVATDEYGDVGFNKENAYDIILGAVGGNGIKKVLDDGSITDITDLMGDFTKKAGYNGASTSFEFIGQINDGVLKYSEAGLGSAEGILGMLDIVTGNEDVFSYTNVGGEASFVHALITKAVDYNLDEYIDKLTGKFYETETQQLSIEMNLTRAASNNAYKRWRELYDKLQGDRRANLKDKHLKELVMNFRIKAGDVAIEKLGRLLGCLNEIDPKWNEDANSGLPYIYYYSYASSDCISAFCLLDEHRNWALAGKVSKYKTSNFIRSVSFPITSWY